MPQGLEVYNETGVPYMQITTRLPRKLGVATLSAAASSLSHADFASGTPWYFLHRTGLNIGSNDYKTITFSGTNMDWTATSYAVDCTYGIY